MIKQHVFLWLEFIGMGKTKKRSGNVPLHPGTGIFIMQKHGYYNSSLDLGELASLQPYLSNRTNKSIPAQPKAPRSWRTEEVDRGETWHRRAFHLLRVKVHRVIEN